MRTLKLYCNMVLADLRSQMQHRASFIMQTVGNFIATTADFVGIYTLFVTFGALEGWTVWEIAILYGLINLSFALAEGIGRGFDMFSRYVQQGDFDRYLLRPRGTVLQVLGATFGLSRLGRIGQAGIVLVLGIAMQTQPFGFAQYAVLLLCLVGGFCLFFGLLMIQAAACFYTIESLEAFNVLTYGGITMGAYPLDIYRKWFRDFFLYVVPLGFVNYLPCAVLFGKELPFPTFTSYLAPVAGGVFLAVGLLVWQLGVRHYRSVGA